MTDLTNIGQSVETEIEAAYRRDYRKFLRVAAALLGNRELAQEAVQESFARAIYEQNNLRSGSVEPWLYRVLVNHCKNLNRYDRHRTAMPLDIGTSGGSADDWPEVRAAVTTLPERQRLVLFLRHYADLDYGQIAEVAGIAPGTVAATLHAAHAGIRATMEEGAA